MAAWAMAALVVAYILLIIGWFTGFGWLAQNSWKKNGFKRTPPAALPFLYGGLAFLPATFVVDMLDALNLDSNWRATFMGLGGLCMVAFGYVVIWLFRRRENMGKTVVYLQEDTA